MNNKKVLEELIKDPTIKIAIKRDRISQVLKKSFPIFKVAQIFSSIMDANFKDLNEKNIEDLITILAKEKKSNDSNDNKKLELELRIERIKNKELEEKVQMLTKQLESNKVKEYEELTPQEKEDIIKGLFSIVRRV